MSRVIALSARIVVACILAVPCAAPLGAQRLGREAPRPNGAVADTNDAQAYFDYGVRRFEIDPVAAASAFYCAARLNPGSADAWYARRAAILMTDEGLRRTFVNGGRNARDSKQLCALDSLYLRALNLNPLLYRRFDKRLLMSYITQETMRAAQRGSNDVSRGEVDYVITTWLQRAGPEFRAWVAYGDGKFEEALRLYASAEKATKFKAGIRIERGRILGMRGEVDSAVAQFQMALTEMRSRDTKGLVYFYDSKALFEHTIGILLEGQSDYAGGWRERIGTRPAGVRDEWRASCIRRRWHLSGRAVERGAGDAAVVSATRGAGRRVVLGRRLRERELGIVRIAGRVPSRTGRADARGCGFSRLRGETGRCRSVGYGIGRAAAAAVARSRGARGGVTPVVTASRRWSIRRFGRRYGRSTGPGRSQGRARHVSCDVSPSISVE